MTASSQHVTDYIFPSVPISQLTEEKNENDCIFIFFKDLFFDYVSACASVHMTTGTHRDQKRTIRPLGDHSMWCVCSNGIYHLILVGSKQPQKQPKNVFCAAITELNKLLHIVFPKRIWPTKTRITYYCIFNITFFSVPKVINIYATISVHPE